MSPRRGLGFNAPSSRALRPWLHDAAPSGLKRRDRFWLRLDSVRRAWRQNTPHRRFASNYRAANPPSPALPAERREPDLVEFMGSVRRWMGIYRALAMRPRG